MLQAQAAPRAIWTWEPESYAMLQRESEADAAIAFLQQKGIQTVYLYADAYQGHNLIAEQPRLYGRLIQRLHRAGIKTYALLGSAYLHTERYVLPSHRKEALAMVQRIFDYNAQAAPEQRFDGINLDIEPHILPQWSSQRLALLAGFLDMSSAIMAARRQAGQTLPIGPAIPFWLDGIALEWQGKRKPASEHVQDVYDYVALMDYRDHALGPDGIVSHGADEIAYAKAIGRTVWLGVETLPNELKKVSFEHLREADMERELGLAQRSFEDNRAFGGFVIHHYSQYQRWLKSAK
ncbi:hypothetical protein GJ700_28795 [Duganella sp. FT92W]|uniref:Uncharacterized protein n=2 Tax=Pseudoduganella rivuli TaxID=2666085 RepID=A0A7X2LVR1_9BURK|nr:hypothetical protein [Pseudoduganella rivuli]MRV75721.1 hypothetical protein [Pseudoduganella rivuli]